MTLVSFPVKRVSTDSGSRPWSMDLKSRCPESSGTVSVGFIWFITAIEPSLWLTGVCVCVPVLGRTGVIFWVDSCLRASNPYRILNYSVVDALTLQTQISRQTGFQRQKPWAGPTLTLWTQSQSDFLVQRNKKKKKHFSPKKNHVWFIFGLFLLFFWPFIITILFIVYLHGTFYTKNATHSALHVKTNKNRRSNSLWTRHREAAAPFSTVRAHA